MQIVWDEPKRLSTLKVRGLDFYIVTETFFETAQVITARNSRYKAVGLIDGLGYVVIFKLLGTEGLSIISLRRANRKERAWQSQRRA